jgi:hypothetical protein
MLLEPVDPNQRFRERRRQARRRRAVRRIGFLVVSAIAISAVALGMSVLTGGHARTTEGPDSGAASGADEPEPPPLPDEIRGVHVTMTLASVEGMLDDYLALTAAGLNTIELDVKDEHGEIGFKRPAVALARRIGAARSYYDARRAAAAAEAAGVYLIGRVVVFADPILATSEPGQAIQWADGSVWTSAAGLAWTDPYDRRVWKYDVDVAAAAVKAGFDEIMFDYVRFPTDGDVAGAMYPAQTRASRTATIARFLRYARGRLEPLGARVSAAVFGLSATREMGIGQRPRSLSRYVDAVYPMVYPSHFGPGQYDLADPNAVPGITVARSLTDFRRALRGRRALLVPWLQDFSLGREYTLEDVRAQILAARDANTKGFLLWNPAGVYTRRALRGL